jgi:hypothetical protein
MSRRARSLAVFVPKLVDELVGNRRASGGQRLEAIEALRLGRRARGVFPAR